MKSDIALQVNILKYVMHWSCYKQQDHVHTLAFISLWTIKFLWV